MEKRCRESSRSVHHSEVQCKKGICLRSPDGDSGLNPWAGEEGLEVGMVERNYYVRSF